MKVHHHKYAIILISAAAVVVSLCSPAYDMSFNLQKHQHSGDTERVLSLTEHKSCHFYYCFVHNFSLGCFRFYRHFTQD